MAVDTPAKIAIIGAGPIGLEAALYARYLGYEVEVFDELHVCSEVLSWEEQRMLTPFCQNCSRLGLASLAAQDANYHPPDADSLLTNREWYERYLRPLSETDLVADCLRLNVHVQSIGKVELSKSDCPRGEYDRGNWDFRLVLVEIEKYLVGRVAVADVVLDCDDRIFAYAGHGGVPAIGEILTMGEAVRHVLWPASMYAGKAVLVVGDDLSAAFAIQALRSNNNGARITWLTRHEREQRPGGPFHAIEDDPLPERRDLLAAANRAAVSGDVLWLPGTWLEGVEKRADRKIVARLSGECEEMQEFDFVLAFTGYRPTWESELQLDICPITDAPRPFSEYLLKRPSPYSVEYPAPDPAALITSEPNYYVLGAKSFGRMPGFLFQHGLRQIRDVFTLIGDRADLDLYAQK